MGTIFPERETKRDICSPFYNTIATSSDEILGITCTGTGLVLAIETLYVNPLPQFTVAPSNFKCSEYFQLSYKFSIFTENRSFSRLSLASLLNASFTLPTSPFPPAFLKKAHRPAIPTVSWSSETAAILLQELFSFLNDPNDYYKTFAAVGCVSPDQLRQCKRWLSPAHTLGSLQLLR